MNKKQSQFRPVGILDRLRVLLYRLGRRPAPGAILYSPSLAILYAFVDYEEKHGHGMFSIEAAQRRNDSMKSPTFETNFSSRQTESGPLMQSAAALLREHGSLGAVQAHLHREFVTLYSIPESGVDPNRPIAHRGKKVRSGEKK